MLMSQDLCVSLQAGEKQAEAVNDGERVVPPGGQIDDDERAAPPAGQVYDNEIWHGCCKLLF